MRQTCERRVKESWRGRLTRRVLGSLVCSPEALEFNALRPNFEDIDRFEYLSQVLPEQREGSQTHDQEHEGPPHGRDSLQNQFKSVWLH